MCICIRNLRYILIHKWFVFLECRRLGIFWLGIVHDLSKFRLDEFAAYARAFYGKYPYANEIRPAEFRFQVRTQEQVQDAFDLAWLLHQKRNKHHWQYWILVNDDELQQVLPMPERYRLEMLADWIGAGKARVYLLEKRKGNVSETREWYLHHRDKMLLHPVTRTLIEHDLGVE